MHHHGVSSIAAIEKKDSNYVNTDKNFLISLDLYAQASHYHLVKLLTGEINEQKR